MTPHPAPPAAPGLTAGEAAERLRREGANVLPQPERRSHAAIVLAVLREPMLLLLALLALVTWIPPVAVLFGFAAPPLAAWCGALLAPLLFATAMKAAVRARTVRPPVSR